MSLIRKGLYCKFSGYLRYDDDDNDDDGYENSLMVYMY